MKTGSAPAESSGSDVAIIQNLDDLIIPMGFVLDSERRIYISEGILHIPIITTLKLELVITTLKLELVLIVKRFPLVQMATVSE